MEQELIKFLDEHVQKAAPLFEKANKAYFDASISGKSEDFKKAAEYDFELNKIYADKNDFEKIKEFKNNIGNIDDQLLKRQIELLYNQFAGNQYSEDLIEQIITLSNKLEEKYSTFRASVNGKKLTDNEIEEVLEKSTDNSELEQHWKASKEIGNQVADDVKKLVGLRNKAANELGYDNYHQMSLSLNEQNPDVVEKLFDNLDDLTRDEFLRMKAIVDDQLEEKYGIDKTELMPWHYQDRFFQQGPQIFNVDFDKYYRNKDLVDVTNSYYRSLGLEISDLIENSDLYEKEGKYQHAYCINTDKQGDVRVVANVKPNHKWMGTLLHEFGHAVYDKYVNSKLPWLLREHAHIFTTEAIAMLFGRFSSLPIWIKDVIGISDEEKGSISEEAFNSLKLQQLVFSRWVQVMFRFEKAMFENPEQNLNELWWSLVEKYQNLKRPENWDNPDWAAKIHIALYPAYYHNYILGELLASQLFYYITEKVLKSENPNEESLFGNSDAGEYLKHLFFSYGALYPWNELIVKATGEELNPAYYVRQFVK